MAQTGLIQNELNEDETTGLVLPFGQQTQTPTTTTTTAPAANAASYTPAMHQLNEDTETVQGRLRGVIGEDSPLMQDARTRSSQQMNSKGLLNTTMAVGEGEKAVIQTALPIASQDANSALSVSTRNQDTTNQARQFGATAQNQFGMQRVQGEQAIAEQTLRGQQANELAGIEATYKNQLQSSQSSSQLFSQIAQSIGEILKNENIPVAQKNQLIQKQNELLQNGLAVIGGIANVDLTALLSFGDTTAPANVSGTSTVTTGSGTGTSASQYVSSNQSASSAIQPYLSPEVPGQPGLDDLTPAERERFDSEFKRALPMSRSGPLQYSRLSSHQQQFKPQIASAQQKVIQKIISERK